MTYSSNTFTYFDKSYTLNLTLYTLSSSSSTSMVDPVSLDGQDIESFEYSTKLNSLVVEGKVIYQDKYGKVDRLFT